MRVSYLEVYEERVYDLLDVSNREKPMEEWETVTPLIDGEGNQVLKGLSTFEVENEGEKKRKKLQRPKRKRWPQILCLDVLMGGGRGGSRAL